MRLRGEGTSGGGPARKSRGCKVAYGTRHSAGRACAGTASGGQHPASPEEDGPASPAAAKSLMERTTPQVGPAPVNGVSPQFFRALIESGSVTFASSLRKTKD